MTRRLSLALMLALSACPRGAPKVQQPSDTGMPVSDSEFDRRRRLVGELEDEILTSYERDELPEVDTDMVPQATGPARIGVGPGDVYYGEQVRRLASSRWPLQLAPGTPTSVRSKRLQIHLSSDVAASAAWASDELSWRITMCGRTAVIPLRMTALFAHDGDRWVQVFEHLSFGRIPQPTFDGQLRGSMLVSPDEDCRRPEMCPVVDRNLSDDLSRSLSALLSGQAARVATTVATGTVDNDPTKPAPTFLLGPDPDGEWRGTGSLETIRLIDGKIVIEGDRRIGTVGKGRFDKATIAYWVGNLTADLRLHPGTQSSKVRMRGTFVFEKRKDRWVVVQGHLSQPIDDIDLAQIIYGTALISEKPLQITCDDGSRSTAQQP
ncbi:MAG TPA: nuclear transport factor 2 family protein [Kofleriaceae bacterium]|nr:nuclear transport factor 2 family protein [Kofleriaceae bacterium]